MKCWRRLPATCSDWNAIEREQSRLTDAVAAGADAPILIQRLKTTEAKRRELAAALATRRNRRPRGARLSGGCVRASPTGGR